MEKIPKVRTPSIFQKREICQQLKKAAPQNEKFSKVCTPSIFCYCDTFTSVA